MTTALARLRVRSRAEVPFVYAPWLTVPTCAIECVVPAADAAALLRHAWIEAEPIGVADAPTREPAPANVGEHYVRVRLRARGQSAVRTVAFGEVTNTTRIVTVTKEQLATLHGDGALDVRTQDASRTSFEGRISGFATGGVAPELS
jgi:hypothetical protein